MYLTLRICLSLIFLLIPLRALAQTSELPLNGIAIHSELGQEQFIAALYSNVLSDQTNILINGQALRMELKIVSPEGMTLRRFSRMWIEGMSVNNDPDLLTVQADNMVLFDSLFKGRLVRGDNIVFSHQLTRGVDISLNGVMLGNIPSGEFFTMLLRTWIGRVPLSTDFKNAILQAGHIDTKLEMRFDAIHFTPTRSQTIAQWVKTKPASTSSSSKKADADSATLVSTSSNANSSHALLNTTTASSISSKVNVVAISSAQEESQPLTQTTTDDEDEKPLLTAQTLLVRQFYISALLKKIRANTKYPTRANELGQGGNLRITLVVDRNGKITHSQFVQGSQYSLLNQAVLEAIKQSTPLPPMPEELTGSSFEFTVPINFVPVK